MPRRREKKALYEVLANAKFDSVRKKSTDSSHIGQSAEAAFDKKGTQKSTRNWARGPRMVQFNDGRIDMSIPYSLAVAVLLAAVLLLLVVFRFGLRLAEAPASASAHNSSTSQANANPRPIRKPPEIQSPAYTENTENNDTTTRSDGDNVIVLVQYNQRRDLLPVQRHFSQYGIATEIISKNGEYFLITEERFHNTNTPGTPGYQVIQKIAEIGAQYKNKAPQGYETFAPNYFSDAYGKKLEN